MVKNIKLSEVDSAEQLRKLLDQVKNSGDQFVLEDQGQPQAALLSMADLQLLNQAKSNKDKSWADLFANLKQVHDKNKNFSASEVDDDVDQAIRAIRQG